MAEKGVIMNISAQVDRLVERHSALTKACSVLTAERDSLRNENRTLKLQVKELQAQIAKLQLSDGLGARAADKEQARARINRLLREVDRCIALLDKNNGDGTNDRDAAEEVN